MSDNMSMTSDELKETKKELKKLQQEVNTRVYTLKKVLNNVEINGRFYRKYVETYNIFGSGSQGTFIRNAITGERTSDYVGSINEDKYFKVISTRVPKAQGSVTLFYSSPSEYEDHNSITLPNHIKDEWRNKQQKFLGIVA